MIDMLLFFFYGFSLQCLIFVDETLTFKSIVPLTFTVKIRKKYLF